MKRRDFLMAAAAGAAVAATGETSAGPAGAPAAEKIIEHDAPPRNRHPYADLDWVQKVSADVGYQSDS